MSSEQILIFTDLDGSLLDHYSYQATPAEEILEQLDYANIPVILNTSKTVAEVEIIQQKLQLKSPFIVENGAAIYMPTDTFAEQPEGTETKAGYWVKSFCARKDHWLDLLSVHTVEFKHLYQGFSSITASKISELTGLTLNEARRAKQRDFGEPINWLGNESSKKAFIECVIDNGANVVQGGRFIHVGGYCDKGQAMIWLAEQYRANNHKDAIATIALGDGENDTTMLEAADFAVQIRSPIHSYPVLSRQHKVLQTSLYGPEGWTVAIEQLLTKQLIPIPTNQEVSHG